MRNAVAFSFSFHILIGGAMAISLPSLFDDKKIEDQPIIVEMVEIDEKTESPQIVREIKKIKKNSLKPKNKPFEKKIQSSTQDINKTKTDSIKISIPLKNEKKVDDKPIKKLPMNIRPSVKPGKIKKDSLFDSKKIALLIDKSIKNNKEDGPKSIKEDAEVAFLKKPTIKESPIKNVKFGPRLTMNDISAIRHQIEKNWNPPSGARDAFDLIIRVRITLNPDGSLYGAPKIVDRDRLKNNFYRAAAESAIRAIYKSEPLKNLPKGKYQAWKDITLTFNPKELLGG